MEAGWSARRVARQLGRSDCVVTTGSERCHLHEDQTQDALDRPVVEKTAASIRRRLNEGHLGSRRPLRVLPLTPPIYASIWSVATHEESGLQENGTRLSLATNPDSNSAVMTIVFVCGDPVVNASILPFLYSNTPLPQLSHTARVSQDCLRTVTTLPLPVRSPDLSPIKPIWDHLGWRVWHPASLNELEASLQQIWNEMSQDIIQSLYASMPDHIASCIRARGGSTGY
ncbi:transposable element Tcb1 transposase [Trichonephila clavipes]|nr:transposable element Tcb1 transposase [Trichonephila clavipes]